MFCDSWYFDIMSTCRFTSVAKILGHYKDDLKLINNDNNLFIDSKPTLRASVSLLLSVYPSICLSQSPFLSSIT